MVQDVVQLVWYQNVFQYHDSFYMSFSNRLACGREAERRLSAMVSENRSQQLSYISLSRGDDWHTISGFLKCKLIAFPLPPFWCIINYAFVGI